jgi:hypothetical protein
MQSEHQHIDEFFRKKEEEWDAGSDDLQRDWQQMLILMPSAGAAVDTKPSYYRVFKLLSGVVAMSVLIAVLVILTNREKEVVSEKKTQKNEAAVTIVSPPVKKRDSVATPADKPQPVAAQPQKKLPAYRSNEPQPTMADTVAALIETPKPDAAVLMRDFYEAIKKESQEFTIPADRDTTIKGKEGSLLKINGYTFTGSTGLIRSGRISITLTEFYRYDDMIAAKLHTTSGEKQLVTGGMIHLQAENNGEPVQIAFGNSIDLKIPTDNYDPGMELFVDLSPASDKNLGGVTRDGSKVSWVPAGQLQYIPGNEFRPIYVFDLTAPPFRVAYRKDMTIGKFYYTPDSLSYGWSHKNLLGELYKRYGTYYDLIKLRKAGRKKSRQAISGKYMDFKVASAAGLVSSEDSVDWYKQRTKDSLQYIKRLKKLKHYQFRIIALGWINCDRFYNDPRPLTELTINLGEGYDAKEFVTQLVFPRMRSVMNIGSYSGSMVQFPGIPEDEPVQLVSVGVKDGKVVSSITPYIVRKGQQKTPVFEETTPEAFKQKLAALNIPYTPQ